MTKFRVELPELTYWQKQIKCQFACPVRTDARGYVRAIAEGDYRKAYRIALEKVEKALRYAYRDRRNKKRQYRRLWIQRIGAGRAATVTYLVPLFAVAWAWMLLDEPLTLTMGIAGALILGSVAMSQRR